MSHDTSFAYMTIDTSPAAGLVHVSPIFFRSAPSRRGSYVSSRLARTRRTDARQARRFSVVAASVSEPTAGAAASSPRYVDVQRDANAPSPSATAAPASLTRYSDAVPGNTTDLRRRTGR